MIETVNAGDTVVALHNLATKATSLIADQQMDVYGLDPTNRLGRTPTRIKPPIPDISTITRVVRPLNHGVFAMTDGAFGNWRRGRALENYDFDAAYSHGPLLQDAIDSIPNLEGLLRQQIKRYVKRHKNVDEPHGAELVDPMLFSLSSMGWDTWDEVVLPYIRSRTIPRKHISPAVVSKALLDRRICWALEEIPSDDAIVAHVSLAA